MKATEAKLLQILGAVSQFIIPIYQRTYSWTLKECQQLWSDILRTGVTDEIGVHFIGSVVHIDEGLGNLAVQAPKLVIDGQQRLTTVTLLLTALADVLDIIRTTNRFKYNCNLVILDFAIRHGALNGDNTPEYLALCQRRNQLEL